MTIADREIEIDADGDFVDVTLLRVSGPDGDGTTATVRRGAAEISGDGLALRYPNKPTATGRLSGTVLTLDDGGMRFELRR